MTNKKTMNAERFYKMFEDSTCYYPKMLTVNKKGEFGLEWAGGVFNVEDEFQPLMRVYSPTAIPSFYKAKKYKKALKILNLQNENLNLRDTLSEISIIASNLG